MASPVNEGESTTMVEARPSNAKLTVTMLSGVVDPLKW